MKILIGMPAADSRGGPINCEPPFVAALREAGVEVDEEVYVYGDGGTPVDAVTRIKRVVDAARRLKHRVRENSYDLVHLNTSFDARCLVRDSLALRAIGGRVPVFLKMHGSIAAFLATRNRVWAAAQRRLFHQVAGIGVLSTEEMRRFIDAGCDQRKLVIVKNAIEPLGQGSAGRDLTGDRGIARDCPLLLFSSRLMPAKGLLDVINGCKILRERNREFSLIVLGDGPQRAEAENLVRSAGLERHVRFTGYLTEVEASAYHVQAALFIFPSYHDEGLPMVLLKSLSAGLPIITTRIRAAADYLTEPDNCLWVDPKSPVDVAEKIQTLLDAPALARKMSENNRRLAGEFSPAEVAAEYIALYRGIIAK
ncbi:MAG: glycosyltransferase family 4 protein [Pyrinomonadaceae bacterium]